MSLRVMKLFIALSDDTRSGRVYQLNLGTMLRVALSTQTVPYNWLDNTGQPDKSRYPSGLFILFLTVFLKSYFYISTVIFKVTKMGSH
jgi:hypothetical protein